MCPQCREPLVAFELEGVEIDRCIACGGTWLDAGELEQIAELAGTQSGRLSAALHAADTKTHGQRRCPRCGCKLHLVSVGDEPAIELDHCPRGHGLWFDVGEMQSAIKVFADQDEEGAVARFFADMYRHELEPESKGE